MPRTENRPTCPVKPRRIVPWIALGVAVSLTGQGAAAPASGASPPPQEPQARHESQHHDPNHHAAAHGAAPAPADDWLPTEVGQDAFAALAEMVRWLDADPATDWKRVSIRTLRDHLVDMYRVTLLTEVAEEPIPSGFRARVSGEGPTRDAVQRMVPTHASMLDALGYDVEAETTETGAVLTVRIPGPEPAPERVDRLRALGFFGVMTLGDHHRAHHRAMATGRPVHGGHP